MCRLTAYIGEPMLLGDLVSRPRRSVVRQSFDARERITGAAANLNGDGFGVGWYRLPGCVHTSSAFDQQLPIGGGINSSINVNNHTAPPATTLVSSSSNGNNKPDPLALGKRTACSTPALIGGGCGSSSGGSSNCCYGSGGLNPSAADQAAEEARLKETPMAGTSSAWKFCQGDEFSPCVFKSMTPAWSNGNLYRLSQSVVSSVFFAHVRAATVGSAVSEAGCHPFQFGRLMFMHNGEVGGFSNGSVRRQLLKLLCDEDFDLALENGCTDTAVCFSIFLMLLGDRKRSKTPLPPEVLRDCLERTVSTVMKILNECGVETVSMLNFVVTDGSSIAASRYVHHPKDPNASAASLYWTSGTRFQRMQGAEYVMVRADRREHMAIITSEPLTDSLTDWVKVPKNHTITITSSLHIVLHKIELGGTNRPALPLIPVTPSGGLSSNLTLEEHQKLPSRSPYTKARRNLRMGRHSLHKLTGHRDSVMTLLVGRGKAGGLVFTGAQDALICVWNVQRQEHLATMRGHNESVMALVYHEKKNLLFSGGSDSRVLGWDVSNFTCCYTIELNGCGDVLSLALAEDQLFMGCLNTSVQLANIPASLTSSATTIASASSEGGGGEAAAVAGEAAASTANGENGDLSYPVHLPSTVLQLPRPADVPFGYVCSMAVCSSMLCTGGGDAAIWVWCLGGCILKRLLTGHTAAVLSLVADFDLATGWTLFSGSRDHSVRIWDMETLTCRNIIGHYESVLSLAVCRNMIFCGGSGGNIVVVDRKTMRCKFRLSETNQPVQTLAVCADGTLLAGSDEIHEWAGTHLEMDLKREEHPTSYEDYCNGNNNNALINGSGNSNVSNEERNAFFANGPRVNGDGSDALSPFIQSYQRGMNGSFRGLDQPPSARREHSDEFAYSDQVRRPNVNTVCSGGGYSADESATGNNNGSSSTAFFTTHSAANWESRGTGWERQSDDDEEDENTSPHVRVGGDSVAVTRTPEEELVFLLSTFVAIRSVSDPKHNLREECWRAAKYLKSSLKSIGAVASLYCGVEGTSPLVLGRIGENKDRPTITVYGHYDVHPASGQKWKTDPWKLTGIDGFLYGRGATDDKGPIIAVLAAVRDLVRKSGGIQNLPVNVVFALEGEEESGSGGFVEAVLANRSWFDGTVAILCSNTIWVDEERPCVTYGMRGTVDVEIHVSGPRRDLHSGIDGGTVVQPLHDLVSICASLTRPEGTPSVPGFLENVRPVTEDDRQCYKAVDFAVDKYGERIGVPQDHLRNGVDALVRRWHSPAISITDITCSNETHSFTVVPRNATAKVSIRFVPDQSSTELLEHLKRHVTHFMAVRGSPNTAEVRLIHSGDWWLADKEGEVFKSAVTAVATAWGVEPLRVREGGTMPITRFLEDTLQAPAIHLPLGQASDGAHLPNERIRLSNLVKGKEVIQLTLEQIGARVPARPDRPLPAPNAACSSTTPAPTGSVSANGAAAAGAAGAAAASSGGLVTPAATNGTTSTDNAMIIDAVQKNQQNQHPFGLVTPRSSSPMHPSSNNNKSNGGGSAAGGGLSRGIATTFVPSTIRTVTVAPTISSSRAFSLPPTPPPPTNNGASAKLSPRPSGLGSLLSVVPPANASEMPTDSCPSPAAAGPPSDEIFSRSPRDGQEPERDVKRARN